MRMSLYNLFARKEAAAQFKGQLSLTGEVEDLEVELLTRNKERRNCIYRSPCRSMPMERTIFRDRP